MAAWLTKELCIPLGRGYRSTPPLWGVLLAACGVLFFARLGIWQLERADEKAVMTARYAAHAHLPARPLAEVVAAGDIEDRRVDVRGVWDNQRLVFLENQMRGPRAGLHVYTVFVPDGGGTAVLVNRGWVAVAQDIQQLPVIVPAQGRHIAGTLAYPSAFFTVGEPDYALRPLRVPRLDVSQLSAALGIRLQPFVLRQDSTVKDGLIREWEPAVRLGMPPEKHHAYAFQWFSLALAVMVMLVVVNFRKRGDVGA